MSLAEEMPFRGCGVNTGILGDFWGTSIMGVLSVNALSNGSYNVTGAGCNGNSSENPAPAFRAERGWNPSLPGAESVMLFQSCLRE